MRVWLNVLTAFFALFGLTAFIAALVMIAASGLCMTPPLIHHINAEEQ